MSNWRPILHPRDARGRFRVVTSRDVASSAYPVEGLTSGRLSRLFAAVLAEETPDEFAFTRIAEELGRRDELRMSRQRIDPWIELITADRRSGESRRSAMRRYYDDWNYDRYLQAELATRGHVVTQEAIARNVSAVSLFSGPIARANRFASDELKEWWDSNGGRITFNEFVSGTPVASRLMMVA